MVLLKQELDKSRHSEKMATEKLIQLSTNYQQQQRPVSLCIRKALK